MSKLKVLDLFSGIGGFSLGLERTEGFETVAFCEIDKKARQVLRKHWPDTPIFDDVTTLKGDQIGTVDVICGGFPCQDISYAGRGAGLAGERSGLWFEFHRLIKEVRPKWVIAENVSALRSRGLDTVLRSLAEIGYDAEWHCIPASAVGAPHRRDRVWIVAYPQCDGLSAATLTRSPAEAIREEQARQDNSFDIAGASGLPTAQTDVAYPHGSGLEGCQETGNFSRCWAQINEQLARCRESHNYWSAEPGVGGRFDGFSDWLDGFDMTNAHELLLAYVKNQVARPSEILRTLRDCVDTKILQWKIGGSVSLSEKEVLLAYLRQLQKRITNETWLQLAGEEVSEATMRSLRASHQSSCTSHRSKQSEQHEGKCADTLYELSFILARHSEKAWVEYCRENAITCGYDTGIARVANGVSGRVDRIKQLGNAVVPQIPQIIGSAILSCNI